MTSLPTPRQARLIWLAVTGLAIATLVGLAVTLVWGLGRVVEALAPVFWPLAIAGVIACLLDPVVDLIERKIRSRPRAIIAVFAMALILVAGLFGSIVPQLVSETRDFAERVPDYASRLGSRIEFWLNQPHPWMQKLLDSKPATPVANPVATNSGMTAGTRSDSRDGERESQSVHRRSIASHQ